ncbi:hypothetical protein F5884DRAFT_478888 [Xylogone sp. PMI_703]|nr:hypothetical protein F5884DRAFT_478888 [Xylogone sp. PMI_703]
MALVAARGSWNRSPVDLLKPATPVPIDCGDASYGHEVLLLEDGQTEAILDKTLETEAEQLGISILDLQAKLESLQVQEPPACDINSAAVVESHHVRADSAATQDSISTFASSTSGALSTDPEDGSASSNPRKRPGASRRLSFSEYEKYLLMAEEQAVVDAGFTPALRDRTLSIFSVSSRRRHSGLRQGIRQRFRMRRSKTTGDDTMSCICCREDFKTSAVLHNLPCHHQYCAACLRVLISQARTDERQMPPRCCNRPIPGGVIRTVLTQEEQRLFMKSVQQFSTPWKERIYCPMVNCGEFIPKSSRVDLKHPFEVVCLKCKTRVCTTCKRRAHPLGKDCPEDWELEAVLRMGENAGWRRCYKCRTLVELIQGCSHITCRCKAQFCYICGAVWDPVVGCPNYCPGEEELERRRQEEAARIAEQEAEKVAREERERIEALEEAAAAKRTQENEDLSTLRARQISERDRFFAYERKIKWLLWTRHGQDKLDLLARYGDLQSKMKERHLKTAAHLEDRQVHAEMELRAALKQRERSIRIRLKHMEAYCEGLGRGEVDGNPARVVTERDLHELRQQYNIRDDLERFHQAKINVMRDKQAKQMEHLLERQAEELEKLGIRLAEEVEGLEEGVGIEEERFLKTFEERRKRLMLRWAIQSEIELKRLQKATGLRFGPTAPIHIPPSGDGAGFGAASEMMD